jgi:ABC-type sugar transport system permease subunit
MVAITLVFRYLFYPSAAGTVNHFLGRFGLGPYGWLNDPAMSKIVVIVMALWHGIGYNIIIWLAGLQSIPQELYEAATVDGANSLQKWRYITIPLSRPLFVFMVIMGTMSNLRRFSDVFTLGGATGSPLRSLQTIVSYFYDKGMLIGQYGIGAAATVVIFFLIMSVTTINLLINSKSNT